MPNAEIAPEEITAAADAMIEIWEAAGLPWPEGVSWLQLAGAALRAARTAAKPTHEGPATVQ
jgi:hypothetical protein